MKDTRRLIKNTLLVILGNFIYAAAVKFFLLPSGLMTGGTTGIALAVTHWIPISVSLFVLVFNIIMLILGRLAFGRAFALNTILSTFAYPIFLGMLDLLFPQVKITEDPLLNMIFAGLGIGVALGTVIRTGASTGGMDIPPLMLQKYMRIPVSIGMYAFDFAILILQAVNHTAEEVLYGILLVLIYTITLDKMIMIGTTKTELKIVSKKAEEIRCAILEQMDRGVTMLEGEGGYLRSQTQIVLSVISNREVPKVEKIIRQIDPESFMIISRVSEVRGRGFTMKKEYK